MNASSIYTNLAKTAALTTLVVSALVGTTTVQARSHYIQDVQYVQGGAQLVITPPQLVIQAPPPVYVAPPVYERTYVPGRIYYINGRAYLNDHPYVRGHAYGHYKVKHHKRHLDRDDRWDRHDGHHDEGRRGGRNH